MNKKLLAGLIAFGMVAVTQADVIAVVNADTGGFTFEDASTGGDTFAGLTGAFVTTGVSWPGGPPEDYWGDTMVGFLVTGSGNTATWTVNGYTPGTNVQVFAHWREIGQPSNNVTDAPYVVNGGTAVLGNHKVSPTANLTLNDGTYDLSFQSLGYYTADGAGQVQVVLSAGTDSGFTVVDAIAIQTVPEPATLGMVAAFGGAILFIRRKLMM